MFTSQIEAHSYQIISATWQVTGQPKQPVHIEVRMGCADLGSSRSPFFRAACLFDTSKKLGNHEYHQCLPPAASHWLLWPLRKHEWFFCDSDEDFPAENRAALIGSSASQSLREQVRSGTFPMNIPILRSGVGRKQLYLSAK